MKLPAYPRTKPSGVEWLGDVPEHWEVKKLGYEAYLQGGYAFASEKFDSEGVPVVRMNNLKRGVLDTSEASCVAPENCLGDFALAEGDLLWGMSGSIGETGSLGNFARVRACDLPAQLNQRVGRFCTVGESIALGFLTYVIQTKFFYDQILLRVTGTAQFNVSSEQVQSAKMPFPHVSEQVAIAAFLDWETGRVDRLVAKKRELIERLKEKRTALISRTVTRGLPPAAARAAGLPANPPLKPSALDWLGDIPKHWDVKSLTRVTISIRNGTSATQLEDESESAVSVTRIESISGGRINFDKVGQVEWTPGLERFRLSKGDILLSHINSLSMVGNCAIFDSDQPLYSGMNLLRIQPEPTVHAPWLWRVLSSDGIRKEISARAKPAINQASVTTTQIKALQLPVPPLPEQAAIAAYLDLETTKLDALVGKVEEAVERLQEYRTALITAAVTGKIDVRKAAA